MSIQPDFSDNVRIFTNKLAEREFSRIFGFSADVLRNAAIAALREARETSDLHSQLSAPGARFYHRFVEAVREEVDMLDGWSANREADNKTSPRARRTDGLAFAFKQGNASTGVIEGVPQPKNKLGVVTVLELQNNNAAEEPEQLSFDELSAEAEARPQTLWLLLFHRDVDDRHVSLEVSLPIGVTDDGKILGWDKRIVLGETGIDSRIVEVRDDGRNEGDDTAVAISAR
ncbi:hypothetical protein Uis1B_0414 [Bifidobacterium margollesii]|uniref:Uncharacterized protein n=2 Tax=Bifidobacterium margollesii TaxID=2020964 RepID=A0A2N5JBW8_9BIFI|nr:hypothetical protein Uis1B_0414 [Bifidobacterium margollesii]